jgi:hypothetical protein
MNTALVCRDEDEPEYFVAHIPGYATVKLEATRPGEAARETHRIMGLSDANLDWQGVEWNIHVPELAVPRHLRPGATPVVV